MSIKIEAKPVELRHKLSQIALFYSVEEARIVSKLSALADAELIFAHDFKKLKNGDYMLSSRALALIFVNGHEQFNSGVFEDSDVFEDLTAFLIRTVGSDRAEDCLMTDYILARALELHQENEQLEEKVERNRKGLKSHQKFEQAMTDFLEVVTPLNSLLH